MADHPAIEARGLMRRYGDVVAVAGLDLCIAAGSIYALLGPNGAGKTTTIAMLTTLLRPTQGAASVAGHDVATAARDVRRRIGVTFQETVLDQDLTAREVLDYHGQLYGMPGPARAARIRELLALVELEDAAGRRVKTYSGGMKRRLELARGLMTDPEVLFLDEPTLGLDPQNRARMWEHLRALHEARKLTVLLTTHDMEEARTLADTVGIIDRGRLVVEGAPEALIAGLGADVVRVAGQGDASAYAERLSGLAFTQEVHLADGLVQAGVDDGNRRLPAIVTAAGEAGFHIDDISVARPSLGDVFLRYTGRGLRDN